MASELNAAVSAWRDLLGDRQILSSDIAQELYGACTTGCRRSIPAAVKLANTEEVRAAILIARRHRVPLYPISTGHNWGYGSANPVIDGCVIADLSEMKGIQLERDLGLVTLEPGVTQGRLRAFLDEQAPEFMVPTTGAGPDCSLVGNALERGYGITPYADHFAAVTSIEAVLPDGSLYRSALAELGGTVIDRSFKWGIGPYLDGLFAQGNFGIVTRMTIALARRPPRVEAFFFDIADESGFEQGVAAVQGLLRSLTGVVGSINLMNSRRVLSMMMPYPADRRDGDGILPAGAVAEFTRRYRFGAWTGVGALYGETQIVKAARSIVRQHLKGLSKRVLFVTPERIAGISRAVARVPLLRRTRQAHRLATLDKSLRVMAGIPSDVALPLAYWRSGHKPAKAALDPARDGCGLIWYPPLVPMRTQAARRYVAMVENICGRHGIEPLITLTSLSDRCFDSSVPLLFERSDPAQVERAWACHEALYAAGRAEGFLPYRLGPDGMRRMTETAAPCWELVAAIKRAIDPDQIIAPGRYAPVLAPALDDRAAQ